MGFLSEKQVTHDERQVKSLDELEAGKIYRNFCFNDGKAEELGTLEIISIEKEQGMIKVKKDSKDTIEELYLENFGIVPYRNKKWNAVERWNVVSYLVPIS